MHSFFSTSAKQQELLTLKGRIRTLQQQEGVLREDIKQQFQKNSQISQQLRELSTKLFDLKQAHSKKKSEGEVKLKSIEYLKMEHVKLAKELQHISKNTQEAKEIYSKKEFELKSVEVQRSKKREQIQELQNEINRLDGIVSSAKPVARYVIDGEYCVNGIHNCKNHPPRQILANNEEIRQHERMVEEARIGRMKLAGQKESLEGEVRKLDNQSLTLVSAIKLTKDNYIRYLGQSQSKEKEMAEKQKCIKQEEELYDSLKQKEEELKHLIEEANNQHDKLLKEQTLAEQKVKTLEKDLSQKRIELKNSNGRADQLTREIAYQQNAEAKAAEAQALERIAREEIAREQSLKHAASQSNAPSLSSSAADDALEQIARAELAAEQAARKAAASSSLFGKIITAASDVVVGSAYASENEDTLEKPEGMLQKFKNKASDVVTTTGGLWPSALIETAKQTFHGSAMQQLDQDYGNPPEPTGDLLIDNDNTPHIK